MQMSQVCRTEIEKNNKQNRLQIFIWFWELGSSDIPLFAAKYGYGLLLWTCFYWDLNIHLMKLQLKRKKNWMYFDYIISLMFIYDDWLQLIPNSQLQSCKFWLSFINSDVTICIYSSVCKDQIPAWVILLYVIMEKFKWKCSFLELPKTSANF